jgi:hypothetical protein
MAKESTLSIILRAIDRASGPLKAFSDKVEKISKKVRSFGDSMTTNVTLPVAGGFAFAARSLATSNRGWPASRR